MTKTWVAYAKHTVLGDGFLRRCPPFYGRALAVFERLAGADMEARRAFAEARLRRVLGAAMRTEYGRAWRGHWQLEEWPLLEKEPLRQGSRRFLAVGAWRTVGASTSGTTGTPLALRRSVESVAVEQAALDWLWRAAGVEPRRARVAVLRGDNIKAPEDREPPFWRVELGGRRLIFSSNHLDASTLEHFLGALERFQPQVLFAYPSCVESLCRLMRERGRRLSIPLCVTSSEKPTPALGGLLCETLGARWVDYYGQAERVALAYALEPGRYRFLPGYAVVELVAVERTADHTVYEIVGTPLWNLAMPLVRYRTGDFVRLPSGLDADQLELVRWGIEPFEGVEGRFGDYLVSPEGAILMGIDHLPRDVERVVRMQVIQERPDYVRLLVIPDRGFGPENIAQIRANVARKLPPSMRVEIETVDRLERTAQLKTPFVIRRF